MSRELWVVWVWVTHQLDGGGRVRVLHLMPPRKGSIHTSTYGLAMHFCVQK